MRTRSAFPLVAALLAVLSTMRTTAHDHGTDRYTVALPDERVTHTVFVSPTQYTSVSAGGSAAQFLRAHPTWRMQCDPRTGVPRFAWGRGIDVPGFEHLTLVSAPQAAWAFVRSHADLLRVDPSNLRLRSCDMVHGVAYVRFEQVVDGYDVLNTALRLRISSTGRVYYFGGSLYPDARVDVPSVMSEHASRTFATAGIDEAVDPSRIEDAGLAILPIVHDSHVSFALVRNHVLRICDQQHWDTYVDATSGAVLWRRNLIRHFRAPGSGGVNASTAVVNGRAMIRISPDSWMYGDTLVPMRDGYVTVNGKTVVTDHDGRFSIDIGSAVQGSLLARLSGPYARARRADSSATKKNAAIQLSVTPGQDVTIVFDDNNSVASERNVFYHITAVRNFTRGFDTSAVLSSLDRQMDGIVNRSDFVCNANWNGRTVNFALPGTSGMQDCGNTGEIPDVIYHEYGHAINSFVYTRITGRWMRDGALSEATADITANMLRDDPRIGIGFFKNSGDGTIRNSDNDLKFPQNLIGEIHYDGMILTGAVWDMRKNIGIERSRHLTHFARYGAPDGANHGDAFAEYFMEILAADDDDADLSNGTPNSPGIIDAFVRHGIPASGMTVVHAPLGDQPGGLLDGYPMTGTITFLESIISDLLDVKDIRVRYTTDGWSTADTAHLAYDKGSNSISGRFPVQPNGSIVRYYLEVEDMYGSVTRTPVNTSNLFVVGFSPLYRDSFQHDSGWTVSTDAASGAWVRQRPIGTWDSDRGQPPDVPYLQPDEDATPGDTETIAWVTGNAQAVLGMDYNDVDDGKTTLTSGTWDLSRTRDPILRYKRWFCNYAPGATTTGRWTARMSSDGGSTWKSIEFTKQHDPLWQTQVFRISDVVELTDRFRVQFTASDAAPGSIVEAALDDLEILDVERSLVSSSDVALAASWWLRQNYPNPFNPSTVVEFSLPAAEQVRLTITTPLGREMTEVLNTRLSAGTHRVTIDAAHLPTGPYVYTLEAGGRRLSRPMLLLR